MFAATKTASAAAGAPPSSNDPQFNYVTMLLHGDGTNGAQNNTFVDSSSNNFTITRNGTPTQGSFSPYGDLWSNQFSGSGQYLTTSSVTFSGDFTVEGWVFIANLSAARALVQIGDDLNANGPVFYVTTAGKFSIFAGSALLTGSATIAANTWVHLAVCRSGSTVKSYVNGVLDATITNSTSFTGVVRVGAEWYNGAVGGTLMNGYISNLRLVTGTALYTSNFTPSTTPLTAVSGTSLLTCQSNRFRDNSSNNFAITVTGTPSVQRFSPFDPAAEYSTSVIGGSGYLNGSQSLSAPAGTAFNFGTGEFTAECWCYSISRSAMMRLFAQTGFSVSNVSILFEIATTGVATAYVSTGSGYVSATGTATVALNAWTHVAMVRDVNTLRLYVNGIQSGTASLTGVTVPSPTSPFVVGCNGDYNANFFPGYISGMRVVKGTCVYPSGTTFTPPTAPLTAITNTSLLLNTVNAGIFDNAMMNDLVTVGNAQVSTSVKKYGTGSLAFDGNGDYLSTSETIPFSFGSGDWTIETWVYFSDVTASRNIYESRATTEANRPVIYVWNGTIRYFNGSTDVITSSTVSTGQWYHLAVCKASGSTRMFINGTQTGSTYTDTITYGIGAGRPLVGAYNATSGFFSGYLDDFRVTKGVARYTANFTPPTAALPNN